MDLYVQCHNVDTEGLPLTDPPLHQTRLGIRTRRPEIRDADGRVFLIAGLGRPRRYFLWDTFEIYRVRHDGDGEFKAIGTGWQLAPPPELKGTAFEEFRSACANFVGFRCIIQLPYSRTLVRLAEAHRPPAEPRQTIRFLKTLLDLLPVNAPGRDVVLELLPRLEPMRALSIRQPHAEAILRGVKRIEYRSGPTNIRGRILVYAVLGRYAEDDEAEMMARYRIRDLACDDLPRGVLVGTVDLYNCDDNEWYLRDPRRASKLLRPKNHP